MPSNRLACFWTHPALVWLVVLATVFAAEAAVMLVLPWAMPENFPWLAQSAIDAVALTVVVAPVLWWTVVRPLKQVIRIRTRFTANLVAGTESLRRRLAHELHDGVGQSMTLLVSGLRSLQAAPSASESSRRLPQLQQIAQDVLDEIRRMSLGLRPSVLDNLGLASAIEQVAAQTKEHHPIELTADVQAIAGERFPEAVETALFRIVQEALQNVVKHSAASRASIEARIERGGVVLEICDNGRGLPPAERGSLAGGAGRLGLIGMHERAALVDGSVTVDSAPGRGTRIAVFIPVEKPDAASEPPAAGVGDYIL